MSEKNQTYFLNWEESCNSDPADVGGKGQNLGRLQRYGFSVPTWGVLTSRAYRDFLQYNKLAGSINAVSGMMADAVNDPANEKILEDIRRKINEGKIPENIRQELAKNLSGMKLLDKPVAVRSSATAEDSAKASFAGIHESFLNITGQEHIEQAIKSCYASLWTPRAVAYRRKMGSRDQDVALAVVIMELIPAVAAGVAFSCDPLTGRRDRVAISANFGLGESVVSGAVEPDEYLLDSTTAVPHILEKKNGSKKQITRLKPEGGTELMNSMSKNSKSQFVLKDELITELGLTTLRIHESLGGGTINQDIEWAFDGKQFFIVQARPVTKLPEPTFPELAGQPVIWSNANIKDAAPFVMTTLSWNAGHNNLNLMLTSNLMASGYHPPPGINWVRLYKGRGYFNLSALQWSFYDAIGSLPAETNNLLGGHQPEIKVPAGNPFGGWNGFKRSLRKLNLVLNILKTQYNSKEIFNDVWKKSESWNQLNFRDMNGTELISHIEKIGKIYTEFAPTYMILASSASLPLDMLTKILEKDFPGRGYSLTNNLLAGSAEITSAEHGYRLIELAKTAQKDKAACKYFLSEHFDPSAFRNEIPVSSQFMKEFEEFLKDFGHRGVYEGELANPRWREDPAYLLENIRAAVLFPGNDYRKEQAEKRKVAEEEITGKLKWSLKRLKINMWVKQARKGSQMREMAKYIYMKPFEPTRLLFQEIGRRLVESGILNELADVYHCSMPELVSILRGYWDGTGLKVLVEERKQLKEELSELDPPDVIIDEVPQPGSLSPAITGQVLTGIGVAAGRAAGNARLIRHPGENSKLLAGDVLVAPSTDPGWTPLFLRAKAVVMEVGGYLSHGAIVAREYGIPAVVNVPGVMKTLHDGETLTVDGDEGKVYRGG